YVPSLFDPQQAGREWARRRLPWTEAELAEQGWQDEYFQDSPFDLSKDWDWIGLLAAGLGDETLVHLPDNSSYERSYHSSRGDELDSEPAELEDEELEEAWRSMSRPQSRDGIARAFLRGAIPVLPDQDYEWWETA